MSCARATLILLVIGVLVLFAAAPCLGEVVSYECNSLPAEAGWALLQAWCEPEEWVDDGRLFHRVEFCPWSDPPEGQQIDYRHSLEAFEGTERFFLEWRLETNGLRSEIPFGAPAAFSAWSRGSVDYRFFIARDQSRFMRDNLLPIVWIELTAGISHTFRLEMHGAELYVLYVDAVVIDSGVPEGQYPSVEPAVNIGARAHFVESTTIWDYIRWGNIPVDGSGDFDSDAEVTLDDFYFFHECLTNERLGINGGPEEDAGPGCRFADFDDDADVDLRDLAAFQTTFTGGE